MRGRISMSLAITLVLAGGVGLSADKSVDAVPFTRATTGQILIPVFINGAGPHQFILDTGANRSVISDTLSTRLSLQPVAVSELVTAGGSAPAPVVLLAAISSGSHRTTDVPALVLPEARLRAIHPSADGIIGQDVLIDAHYTLDYRRRRVLWLDADAGSGGGTRLALRRSEGRLLVELPQSSRRDDVAWMVPDSGASLLVLFRHGGRTAIPASPLGATLAATTMTGDGHIQAVLVPRLRVGTNTLCDQPALLLGVAARAADDRVDGLLPLAGFSSVTINARDGYLVVKH